MRESNARHSDSSANLQHTITRLGIIDDGDVNRAARAAKLRDERLRCGAVLAYFLNRSEVERGEEIQESKARCPGPQEEGDEESDSGEEEKETGAKASARSGGSVAAARGRFRRQDRRSIDPHRRQQHLSTNLCAAK